MVGDEVEAGEDGGPVVFAVVDGECDGVGAGLEVGGLDGEVVEDTAAAGGFLLVGQVHEQFPLSEVFASTGEQAELDTFGSIKQLKRKIEHYLNHPQQRQAMAARAVQRALRDHSMDARMKQTVKFLAEDVYDCA